MMQKISKMVLAYGVLFVVIIGSVEMYLMNPLPIHKSRFSDAFTAHRQRFTRQPQYFLNQNPQVEPAALLFQQSQQIPGLYNSEPFFNIQQQPIYYQTPPQEHSRYAPKTQAPRSESASNLYNPLHVNIEAADTRARPSSNRDFLSTIEIIDNQGRPSNLKDLGISNIEGQMSNPELAEQLISIFEKINQDLMNADFVPLDVEGANQQIGHMLQSHYRQQDIPIGYQTNSEPIQQKSIEYKTISTKVPIANYTTSADHSENKRYQLLKPVRSHKANTQHHQQSTQQQLNLGQLTFDNDQPKQYGTQTIPQVQLLKEAEEKRPPLGHSKFSTPLPSNQEFPVNNFSPTVHQVPQTVSQPLRITQRPPIFDNAHLTQKDVSNDPTGFNDANPILPLGESAISQEKPMVPQVISFDSRINPPSQIQNKIRIANEKPSIPQPLQANFQDRPDIWIPMSMHPVQHQQQQNFFRYESPSPANQVIVQQKEQHDYDSRLNLHQAVTQEQESFSTENQNEQLQKKQQAIVSQTNIPRQPSIQTHNEFSQQKEQQQQELIDSQVENQDEQQKLFDGSFGDSSTFRPLVNQFSDLLQSKPKDQTIRPAAILFNSENADLYQVNSQKSLADLNSQSINHTKIDQLSTQQKEHSIEDQQQQEVIFQRKEQDNVTEKSNLQQTQRQQQQEELEPPVTSPELSTTPVPTTTITTTTTTTATSAPITFRKPSTTRVEQTKTRKIRIQTKNRSPVQIQRNSIGQQRPEPKRSNIQQIATQTAPAVSRASSSTSAKSTQTATGDLEVPRLATRRLIVKSARSKRPPPSVVKQQQSSQEELTENKSSLQEQSSGSPKTVQGETWTVKLSSSEVSESNFGSQQRSIEDSRVDKETSKPQQQQTDESNTSRDEASSSFNEQIKMDVASQQEDGFQPQNKLGVITTQKNIVNQQKDDSVSSNPTEEVALQQKQDFAQQIEALPEQVAEVSQQRDTSSSTQEPAQTFTQQQPQQQQVQEDVREQQKDITTTEIAQTQQQSITTGQLDSNKSQTEQIQDQDLDMPTNKPQIDFVQTKQEPVVQEKQQQTFDSSQNNEGFQADEEAGVPSTTRRPPTRFFFSSEQKELAQEKDTDSSEQLSDEEAEQQNSENLTAKLSGIRNGQQTAVGGSKRVHTSTSARRHNNHHELTSHQISDTYNPLQFEPERIVSPKNSDGSLQNTNVNL